MPDRVTVPVEPGYSETFRSRDGVVGRDLDRRAGRVQDAARRQAGVNTGRLRSSISKEWATSGSADRLTVRVGSTVNHALVHHQGSRPHVIRARSVKALRYTRDGKVFFARSVNHPGTQANRYLADNLPLAVRP